MAYHQSQKEETVCDTLSKKQIYWRHMGDFSNCNLVWLTGDDAVGRDDEFECL